MVEVLEKCSCLKIWLVSYRQHLIEFFLLSLLSNWSKKADFLTNHKLFTQIVHVTIYLDSIDVLMPGGNL